MARENLIVDHEQMIMNMSEMQSVKQKQHLIHETRKMKGIIELEP